ncbi:MAG: tyrosine-type recombinase/integrase [Pseudobdellovibrionaceae bacterium]
MKKSRKWEQVPGYAGISRLSIFVSADGGETGRWCEPRPPRYRVNAYKPDSDGNPVRHRPVFSSFEEAKKFRANFAIERIEAHPIPSHEAEMTFRELKLLWVAEWLPHKNLSTQVRYKSYLQHFEYLDDYRVVKINPVIIDGWITHIKNPAYLAKYNSTRCDYTHEHTVLKSIFNFYVTRFNRNYVLPFIPDHRRMLKVKDKPKQNKDLTVDEFRKFLDALGEDCMGTPWELVYYIALMQYAIYGRIQEAAALHYEDFQFGQNKIFVCKKVVWPRSKGLEARLVEGSKTGEGKELPMSALASKTFREWTLKTGIRSGRLFSYKDKLVEYRNIQYRYDKALKKAGLPFSATHLIRHASLTEFYDTCEDILTTQKMAGHSDLKSTSRYAKARDKKVQMAQEKMDQKLISLFPK